MKWKYALVYLVDIFIYTTYPEQHIGHVRSILKLLNDAGVILRVKKCKFFAEVVDSLGHIILPTLLEIASRTTDAIRGLQ